jgi:hypothetical protein
MNLAFGLINGEIECLDPSWKAGNPLFIKRSRKGAELNGILEHDIVRNSGTNGE